MAYILFACLLVLSVTESNTIQVLEPIRKISVHFENQEQYYTINIIKNEGMRDKECENVETLNLDEMHLRDVKNNIIRSNALRHVSLQNNLLENIPYNIFDHIPHLICLNLSRNRIILYNGNSMEHEYLQVLDLSYQDISSNVISSVEQFDAETEEINKSIIFDSDNMHFPNLKFLDLSGNDISEISWNFSMSFPKLTHLYLNNMNALIINPHFFNKIPTSLRVLHLENNKFHNLTLENIGEVTALFLDGNPELKRIDIASTKLKILSLSNCTKLTEGFFDTPYLEKLDLSGNNFYSVNNIHFEMFQSLRTFLLDHNKLSEIPLLMNQLIELSLSYNVIRYIKPNSFAHLISLKKLSLKGNSIENIEQDTFSGLKTLRYLDLSENQLKNLHYNWILPLMDLRFLNANSNQFATISDLAIRAISSLEHLCVKNNNFTEIITKELDNLPYIITVYLA